MEIISIAVADSHKLVRLGLKQLLSDSENFKIVAEASNDDELISKLKQYQPDVVILDHNQPNHFQIDTVSAIKKVSTKTNILVISSETEKSRIYRVLELGVNSYLTKTCGQKEIIDAIKATAKGEKFYCTKVLNFLLEKSFSKQDQDATTSPLTSREIEIVKLAARGLLAKEIAGLLNLSTHTVYTHRKNIMKKLQLNTSSELVLYAINNGIIKV